MGVIPSGMGHSKYYKMGMGFIPTSMDFKTWTPQQYIGVAAIAVGALFAARKMGFIKTKDPVIG